MERLLQQKFLALLLALGMLLIAYPVLWKAFSTRLLLDILVTIVFLGAFFVLFSEVRLRVPALVLGLLTMLGVWTDYFLPGLPRLPLTIAFHLIAALFFGFTVAMILRVVHKEASVSADAIYGAFCGYVLVGLAFGHLFYVIEALDPGSFHVSEDVSTRLPGADQKRFLLTYFSFVTLTTVGFGDVVPKTGGARSLAVLEAIIGQFYIAVLIGELIGKRVSQVLSRQPAELAKSPRPSPPAPHRTEKYARSRSPSWLSSFMTKLSGHEDR